MSTPDSTPDTDPAREFVPAGRDPRTDPCPECGSEEAVSCVLGCLAIFPNHALLRRTTPQHWAMADCPACQGADNVDSEPCGCLLDRAAALALLSGDLNQRAQRTREEANRLAAAADHCDTAALLDLLELRGFAVLPISGKYGLPSSLEIATDVGPIRLRTRSTEPGRLSVRRVDGTTYTIRSETDDLHDAVAQLERLVPELAYTGAALVYVVVLAGLDTPHHVDLFEDTTPSDKLCPYCRAEGYDFTPDQGCPRAKGHMFRVAAARKRSTQVRARLGEVLFWGAFPLDTGKPDAYSALDEAIGITVQAIRRGDLIVS